MKINLLRLVTVFLTLVVLSTASISGQTRRTKSRKASSARKTAVNIKPTPVDMGLSVKWSNIDYGATSKSVAGKLIPANEAKEKIAKMGEGWRLPTRQEYQELVDSCKFEIVTNKAGIPTRIVITSIKNGTDITFHLPKTLLIGKDRTFSNPTDGTYMVVYCGDGVMPMFCLGKLDYNIKTKLKNRLNSLGIKSLNSKDWPDEVIKQMRKEGVLATSTDFGYGLVYLTASIESSNSSQLRIRPVYSINVEEDEE